MPAEMGVNPWWAALTVWGVVNAVNLIQAAGFLSRLATGSMVINHYLGRVIIGLSIPALAAMVAFIRHDAGMRNLLGPAAFLAFVAMMACVDYIWPVEFRSPTRASILVPYLVLFFGAILLMGLPMFRVNWTLWMITAASTVVPLASMVWAMSRGVG